MSVTYVEEGDLATPDNMNEWLNEAAGGAFTVKAYGATGDGVTDDTAAFASAFAAAAGGAVLIAPGSYKLTTWTGFTQTADLRVVGSGQGVVTITGPGGAVNFITTDEFNVHLEGLTLTAFQYGVFIDNRTDALDYVRIHDVGFTAGDRLVTDAGSSLVQDLTEFRVTDCLVSTVENAIKVRAPNIGFAYVNQNRIDGCSGDAGIAIGDNDVSGVRSYIIVTENIVTDVEVNSGEAHGIIVYGERVLIDGNVVENIDNAGSGTGAEGIYTKALHATITNNLLRDAGLTEGAITIKGEAGTTGGNLRVCDNYVFFSEDPGFETVGIWLDALDNLDISRNTIIGAYNGIKVNGGQDNVTVCDNRFKDIISRRCISLSTSADGSNFVISGNVGRNVGTGSSASSEGILVTVATGITLTSLQIANNQFHDLNASVSTQRDAIIIDVDGTLNRVQVIGNRAEDCHQLLNVTGDGTIAGLVVVANDGLGCSATTIIEVSGDLTVTDYTTAHNAGFVPAATTLADDATPSVADGEWFVTGGTTTITDFDDGVVGQTIEVLSAHAVTITHGATTILLKGEIDFVMAAGDTLTLTMFEDGKWQEVGRKVAALQEANGVATLANGNTTIVVTHGLDVTPDIQDISVTPIEAWGSATQFWINTPTSTQFTINVDQDPTQDVDFAWTASVQ
jgi:hypothetical protein